MDLKGTGWWPIFFSALFCPFHLLSHLRKKRRKLFWKRWRPCFEDLSPEKERLWIHTLSVGELQAAGTLLRGLRRHFPDYELVLTVTTSSGFKLALERFSDLARIYPSPLHCPRILRRYFSAIRPRLFILVETDVWPDVVGLAKALRVPLILANGALSEKSYRAFQKFKFLARLLYRPFEVLAMASEEDRLRMEALSPGPLVLFLGNLKYDFPPPHPGEIEALRRDLSAYISSPVIVCGSTHAGEEELILQAFRKLARGTLILCPRNPERAPEIKALSESLGFKTALRSRPFPAEVLVVDTLGELRAIYALAEVAFVGGTLVPIGGHNLLEPAALGVPVLFGPYVESVASVAHELEAEGGGKKVKPEPEALARAMEKFGNESLERGERALRVFVRHKGALERYLRLIAHFLNQREELGHGTSPKDRPVYART